jgi:hypothetical protein
MSAWTGRKVRTDPELRRALQRWLDAEQEPQTRLEALRVAAEVAKLTGEMLDQRVVEARSFHHTWADIAATPLPGSSAPPAGSSATLTFLSRFRAPPSSGPSTCCSRTSGSPPCPSRHHLHH